MFNNWSYKQKFWSFVGVASFMAIVGCAGGEYLLSKGFLFHGAHVGVLVGCATAILMVGFGMAGEKLIGKPPVRPIIHVWTHNGILGVCADADYQIAAQEIDRIILGRNAQWMTRIPRSRQMAYFSDNQVLREELNRDDEYLTGSMADYKELAEGCRVRSSEMFVRERPSGGHGLPVNLPTIYRLVYGYDCYGTLI